MLRDALALAGELPPVRNLPASCRSFLVEHAVPQDIIDDLTSACFSDWRELGPLQVIPMVELVEQNLDSLATCINNGYLVLAGGANGDPVAVNCRTRRMVYVSKELLWYNKAGFDKCVQSTPFLYEDFWTAAASDESFPWDYYEARRRWPG